MGRSLSAAGNPLLCRGVSAYWLLAIRVSDRRPALSHSAGELTQVEIITPGADLAFTDLEDPHDRQFEQLARRLEGIHALRHHDRTIGCDVDYAELDALDTWRARANERGKVLRNGLFAADRVHHHVVVDGRIGEECGQLSGRRIVGPRRAKPAYEFDRAFHRATPLLGLGRALGVHPCESRTGCGDSA